MIAYMMKAAILMAIFYLPFVLLFKYQTFFRFNRAYLLISLCAALLIPALPQWLTVDEAPAMMILEPVVISAQQLTGITVQADGVVEARTIDWSLLLWSLYGLVSMVFIGFLVSEFIGIARLYKDAHKEQYNGSKVLVSSHIPTPFSFWRWIFIPENVRSNHVQFQKIFKHEKAHVRKLHTIDSILIELLCAIFWINPFVYIYRNALKTVHEFEADHDLGSTDLVEYTQLLISQSQSGMRLALTNQFFQSQLKTRIMMMMKERSSSTHKLRYLLTLPIMVLAVILFSFKLPDTNGPAMVSFDTTEIPVNDVDAMPLFPGCKDAENKDGCSNKNLIQYLAKSIKYPTEARKAGVEGKVIVQFTVSSEGTIQGVKTLKSLGSGCDEEAIRVVRSMNELDPWTPGHKDGKAVAVELTLPIAFKLPPKQDQEVNKGSVYKEVEEMPLFPGCNDIEGKEAATCSKTKLFEYILGNLKYPKSAEKEGIEGKVIAQFIVEPNGTVSTIKILRSLDPACDKEVIRLLEGMNDLPDNWTPGRQSGKDVRVEMVLPVMFKL